MAAFPFSQTKRALSFALQRRSFAVAASSDVKGSMSGMMVGKVEDKGVTKYGSGTGPSSAWAPDPITGYYRPINHTIEIDPVELRRMLLNHKLKSSSS